MNSDTIDELNIEDNELLNNEWIKEFELYESYYNNDVKNIKISLVYVNENNIVIKVKKLLFLLKEINCLLREEVVDIIKRYSIMDNKKYSLLSILKYNIDLEPIDINHYISEKKIDLYSKYDFLKNVRNIDTIYFNKTISIFQELNELFIFFHCNNNNITINKTKKVFINNKKQEKNTRRKV
jgi:hypothetical protein